MGRPFPSSPCHPPALPTRQQDAVGQRNGHRPSPLRATLAGPAQGGIGWPLGGRLLRHPDVEARGRPRGPVAGSAGLAAPLAPQDDDDVDQRDDGEHRQHDGEEHRHTGQREDDGAQGAHDEAEHREDQPQGQGAAGRSRSTDSRGRIVVAGAAARAGGRTSLTFRHRQPPPPVPAPARRPAADPWSLPRNAQRIPPFGSPRRFGPAQPGMDTSPACPRKGRPMTTSVRTALVPAVALACGLALAVTPATPGAAATVPPGAPGQPAVWTPADKHGFGTSTTVASPVWYTLGHGALTEVYYPDLGTPSVRDLQFVVSDGTSFAERESDSTVQRTRLADPHSLTYQQVNTERSGRWRIEKTYVTDPARPGVLVDVRFVSLTGRPYRLYALYDPSLANNGMDDTGRSEGGALVAADGAAGSGLVAAPAFTATSNGYLGASDGWTDLRDDYRMDWQYPSAPAGNVVQTGRTALDGTPGNQRLTLALGFGSTGDAALGTARASLAAGVD